MKALHNPPPRLMNECPTRLGSIMKVARQSAGFTAEGLAAKMDPYVAMDRSRVYKIESGVEIARPVAEAVWLLVCGESLTGIAAGQARIERYYVQQLTSVETLLHAFGACALECVSVGPLSTLRHDDIHSILEVLFEVAENKYGELRGEQA
jgi:hypothetical protein